jgi:D-xylose transport system substrate-binding protein
MNEYLSHRRLHVLGLLAFLVLLAACMPAKPKPAVKHVPFVGFSLDSLVVERWQRDLDVFGSAVKELGAEFTYRVADQDATVQQRQVRELVALGVDVLVIVPNDAELLSPVVKEVRDRGIAVLSYDRLVRGANVNLYVSFDNEKVGALMAAAATQAAPAGAWLVLNGARTDYNAVLLNRGMHSVFDGRVAEGKVSILGESWPEAWDSEFARKAVEAALGLHKPIDAIIAGNDMLAEAAIGVLAEAGLAGKVAVIGQDAELAACQRLAEGSQYATIYKPIDRLARRAAELAVELARGNKVAADTTINDGRYQVPYVRLEPTLVTKGLLDATVIRDGFHSAAEVYRNVRR